jgi:hypothetical protein
MFYCESGFLTSARDKEESGMRSWLGLIYNHGVVFVGDMTKLVSCPVLSVIGRLRAQLGGTRFGLCFCLGSSILGVNIGPVANPVAFTVNIFWCIYVLLLKFYICFANSTTYVLQLLTYDEGKYIAL